MPHDVPDISIDPIVLVLGAGGAKPLTVNVLTKRISGRERLVMVKPAALLSDLYISWLVHHRPERSKAQDEIQQSLCPPTHSLLPWNCLIEIIGRRTKSCRQWPLTCKPGRVGQALAPVASLCRTGSLHDSLGLALSFWTTFQLGWG